METMQQPSRMTGRLLDVVCAAVVLTTLNSFKPLHVDDPFLYRVAEQIANNPADPYGFDVFWMQWPQPAVEELAPPVLPYWWAGALVLFGDRPLLWKLSLFPFALLLTASLEQLFDRFAHGLTRPLVWMAALSPAFLAGFNLMLDVPAIALGLSALVLFMRSCDRGSIAAAALSGLLAGLSMQTKYTGVLFPAVMLAHVLVAGRVRLWFVAATVAALVFTAWEVFIFRQYGRSMFLGQLLQSSIADEFQSRWSMTLPLVMHLGGLIPAVALAGLAALGMRKWLLLLGGLGLLAGVGSIAYVPVHNTVFTLLGASVCATVMAVVYRMCRVVPEGSSRPVLWRPRGTELFLVLWLLLEIAGYFALAPWPAARRVMGITVAATILVGRLAAQSSQSQQMRGRIWTAATFGILLGLVFFFVDLREAARQKLAAENTAELIRRSDRSARIWFLGHWGFQFYAERADMLPLIPDYSQLRAGDYLLVPVGLPLQEIEYWNVGDFEPIYTNVIIDHFAVDLLPSLSTIPGYYGRDTPLEYQHDPQMRVHVFRALRDMVATTSWPPEKVARWTQIVGQGSAGWAVPALVRGLQKGNSVQRRECARALGEIASPALATIAALVKARNDQDPVVRQAAAGALRKIRGRKIESPSEPLNGLKRPSVTIP